MSEKNLFKKVYIALASGGGLGMSWCFKELGDWILHGLANLFGTDAGFWVFRRKAKIGAGVYSVRS